MCESLREGCAALAPEGSTTPFEATATVQTKESGVGPGLTVLKSVCAVNTTDPVGATGAPPAATTQTPACDPKTGETGTSGAASGPVSCSDRFDPVSRLETVRLRRTTLTLRGVSSDRGCSTSPGRVVKVKVSVAREVGRRCRFLRTNGRFSKPRSCRRTSYLKARGTTRWSFRTRTRFPRGRYKISVGATDARMNVERKSGRRTLRRLRVR